MTVVPLQGILELDEDTVREVLIAGKWYPVVRQARAVWPAMPDDYGWLRVEVSTPPRGASMASTRTMFVRQEAVQAVHVEFNA